MAIRLYCATGNAAKVREFRLAAGPDVEILPLPPCDCPEDGATFPENAAAKALCYSRAALAAEPDSEPALVFADDSGLVVDALGGAPGVYSARYAGPDASDEANNALVLERLAGVPPERRTARFVCWIAVARGGKVLRTFSGEVKGRILEKPMGTGGFGYDPLFFFERLGKTFAEVTPEEKWRNSHRGQAFRKMLAWIAEAADRG
jgi:XTP/dITP diphosphohydrolase